MRKTASDTTASGQGGASRVTERNTSVNSKTDANTTNASTVQANARPESGSDSQSSWPENSVVTSGTATTDCSSGTSAKGGSRRIDNSMTFTGVAETISPSSSPSSAGFSEAGFEPFPVCGANIESARSACSEIPSSKLPKIH